MGYANEVLMAPMARSHLIIPLLLRVVVYM